MKITHEQLLNVYTCVGQIAVPFAQLEHSLDVSIAIIYQSAKGNSLFDTLPRSALSDRLDFVKDCLKKIPALAPYRTEGISLMGEIRTEAAIRNNCLHGFFSAFDESKNQITFTLLDAYKDKQIHTEVVYIYSAQQLLDAGGRMQNLAVRAHKFASDLASAFVL